MATSPSPQASRRGTLFLLGGVAALLLGLGLLAYGLAPAAAFGQVFASVSSGGPPPEDLGAQIDAAIAGVTARVWADALGVLACVAGIGFVKAGLRKPAPRPMEELVAEEVERRMQAHGFQAATLPDPTTPPGAGLAVSVSVTTSEAPAAPSARPTLVLVDATPATPAQGTAAPIWQTQQQVLASRAASDPGVGRRCAACGSVLVAAGRICPAGHPQG